MIPMIPMIPMSGCASAHLSWSELACKDEARTPYPLDYRTDPSRLPLLCAAFEAVREGPAEGQELPILSAYRTPAFNARPEVAGAPHSQHIQGRALDVRAPSGMAVRTFFERIVALATARPGLGIRFVQGYAPRVANPKLGTNARRGWVHFDVRPTRELVVKWEV